MDHYDQWNQRYFSLFYIELYLDWYYLIDNHLLLSNLGDISFPTSSVKTLFCVPWEPFPSYLNQKYIFLFILN